MTSPLDALPEDADHRAAERAFTDAGWTPAGAGDWAIALRAPDGSAAVRISPFDPTGPYTAELYRAAAHTRLVPELFAHRRLAGGGDLQLMEWLTPVDESDAHAFHGLIADRDEAVAELVDIIDGIHARALRELPWCGPLDTNPSNVMRGADGRLVVTDLFYADGPALYATAGGEPDLLVARIPAPERRYLTEIPLAASGPWPDESREDMRRGIAEADARASGH
ncbi:MULTISPECIES: hypothetical protein [unclassified Microbacterium]|uniref:hypothetical protein n=1 Tax=unclassified Microbacterium TaxID=2609290 RepID=UPI0012FB9449|nr:hypothetical protein [Microbacterium sp. MAH-37]MVQ41461.1 hypothetical protein [Microbacterium sp. MAH-37]